MKNKKLLLPAIILFSMATFSNLESEENTENSFIIWAHSDLQPKTKEHLKNFPLAVDDISEHFNYIDIAITAGDIVEKSNSADLYKSYIETRKKINAGAWFEIAGNHECKEIETYKKIVNPHLHYSARAGNILFLFMSNSEKGQQTVIPERIFEWWKNKVISNQDKIIITVTHASLRNSGLIQSKIGLERQFIRDSERFEKILEEYKVDLWISGHSHLPGYLPYTDFKNKDLGGTVFLDIGAIRKDFMTDVESRLLYFKPGSDRLIIRHRDHEDREFRKSRERKYTLSKAFNFSNVDKTGIDEIAE